MIPATCTTEEKVPLTATPVTSGGRPATLDGPLRVSVQSGDGSFTQDPATPNAFFAVSGATPGVTVLLVQADADLGAGEVLIQDTVELTVTDAQATAFGLTAGAAIPK